MYNVSENVGSVRVCYAVLSGRTATRTFYMGLSTFQGDATGKLNLWYSYHIANFAPTHITTEGEDYTSTTSSDRFDDTDWSECVNIPITSDSLDEEEECFGVSLSASSYAGLTLSPDIGTICINDDDGKNHILLMEDWYIHKYTV